EFVKSQKPLFHGTNVEGIKDIEIRESERMAMLGGTKKVTPKAVFFTESKELAEFFAKNRYDFKEEGKPTVYERYLGEQKIVDLSSPDKVDKVFDELGLDTVAYLSDYDFPPNSKTFVEMIKDEDSHISRVTELFDKGNFVDKLKEAGYSGARISERDGVSLALFNPKEALTKSQLTDIYNKAQGKGGKVTEESKLTKKDIEIPPPKFPGVEKSFLSKPKKKTNIIQYFTPAEYHLKQLGFDAEIGQPIRTALMDKEIELAKKVEFVQSIQKEQQAAVKKKDLKASNEKIWELMDKGIKGKSLESNIAKKYRVETNEILSRMNEVRKFSGKEPIKGVKNYILHMLKPEILNEIYSQGVLPPELAKIMPYIPNKNVFLRTAQQRTGVPEEWLVKDPHELMRAMYAIDLRYIHLQKALSQIEPYMKAVKDYVGAEEDSWSPEVYHYIDDWVKQAVKMRPSSFDILADNLVEHIIAPTLRKTKLKISHMPYRQLINFMSGAIHTGALGMRLKPVLRNLVQSTFDWVMYGTKPYLKASNMFHSMIAGKGKAAFEILNKSKVWKTRTPFESQTRGGLNKIFKAGSIGYRASDLHNIGKGLLTRYFHAKDVLKMNDAEALKWMDTDLASTQWSYRREDLPRTYWTTTGRAFWTLGSWWQNYFFRFIPEITSKTFTGLDAVGRKVPKEERMAGLRFLVLIGLLFGLKKKSKELTGTVLDYTGQIAPSLFRMSPVAKFGEGLINISQGILDRDERLLKKGLKGVSDTGKIMIPWYLGIQDIWQLINGDKELQDILFYTEKKKKYKIK
ncbi:MAG: hypothetical protein U9O94_05505, partial [Nanoarchaeota archaeon]|nr:hypothetical protein [Nanoarchaeota archaeon]